MFDVDQILSAIISFLPEEPLKDIWYDGLYVLCKEEYQAKGIADLFNAICDKNVAHVKSRYLTDDNTKWFCVSFFG